MIISADSKSENYSSKASNCKVYIDGKESPPTVITVDTDKGIAYCCVIDKGTGKLKRDANNEKIIIEIKGKIEVYKKLDDGNFDDPVFCINGTKPPKRRKTLKELLAISLLP